MNSWMFKRSPLVEKVLGCAIEVHKQLGAGLFESAYKECGSYEFTVAAIPFQTEVPVQLVYKERRLSCVYRADFVVDDSLLLELKSVDRLLPIHEAQVLTYLKLLNLRQGLLLNFNTRYLSNGMKSFLLDPS
jgi:GxxExxY protein